MVEEEEEEEVVWVVDSIDGLLEPFGCVTQRFLVNFNDGKKLVTNQPTDRPTDRQTPSYRDARTHLKSER